MSTTDKILELLDNALQSSPERDVDHDSMGQYLEEDQCWRCMRNATPEGTTCTGCLAFMEGKSDEDPRVAAPLPLTPGTGLVRGPGFFVSEHLIVVHGHRIVDPGIISRVLTIETQPEGWVRICVDLGRALREAMGHMQRFAVRWGSNTMPLPWADVPVPLRRRPIRFERQPTFRYTADPEEHPEHLDPLVRAVMGRGPVDDPVLHSDDWSGWMGTIPPWVPPTALDLLADEIRAAAEDVVGPPSPVAAGLLDRCPTHGVELQGGLCRRCHR